MQITKTNKPENKEVVLGDDGEPIINTEKQRSVHAEDYDPEIFDDGDFYQMLLKELIESGMNDVQGTLYTLLFAKLSFNNYLDPALFF